MYFLNQRICTIWLNLNHRSFDGPAVDTEPPFSHWRHWWSYTKTEFSNKILSSRENSCFIANTKKRSRENKTRIIRFPMDSRVYRKNHFRFFSNTSLHFFLYQKELYSLLGRVGRLCVDYILNIFEYKNFDSYN